MRGRNTENHPIENVREVTECQGKQHVIMKYVHEEKHVIFEPIGEGRRKKEICDGVQVFIAITG